MTAMKRLFQHYTQLIFFKNGERTFYHITAVFCTKLKLLAFKFWKSVHWFSSYVETTLWHTYIHTHRQTDIHTYRHTYMQTDRQTELNYYIDVCLTVILFDSLSLSVSFSVSTCLFVYISVWRHSWLHGHQAQERMLFDWCAGQQASCVSDFFLSIY